MTLQMLTHQEESSRGDIVKERVKQTRRRHHEQTIFIVEYKYSFHARFGPKILHLLRTYLDNICPNSCLLVALPSWKQKLPL